jgi:hypothetical protein
LPALSRPRTRIRASLLPNTEENILENKIPIFFIAKWEIIKWRFFQSISWSADRRSWIRSAKQSPFPLCNQEKKKKQRQNGIIFSFLCIWYVREACLRWKGEERTEGSACERYLRLTRLKYKFKKSSGRIR